MTRNINKTKKIRQEISILLKMHGNKQVFQMINILHPLNSKKKSQTNSRMIKWNKNPKKHWMNQNSQSSLKNNKNNKIDKVLIQMICWENMG